MLHFLTVSREPIADHKDKIFKEFTAVEVCNLLTKLLGSSSKINLPLLNYYVKNRIITPSGRGMYRGRKKFSFKDLVLLYWLIKLKKEGLQIKRFKEACDLIQKRIKKHSDLLSLVLATDGESVYLRKINNLDGLVAQVLSGSNKGQYIWVFGFKSMTEEIESVLNDKPYQEFRYRQVI